MYFVPLAICSQVVQDTIALSVQQQNSLLSVPGRVIRSFGPHCTQILPLKGEGTSACFIPISYKDPYAFCLLRFVVIFLGLSRRCAATLHEAKQARTNEILEEGRCHFMLGSATVNSLRKRLSAKPRRQRSACRSAKIWCGSSDHTSSGPRCRVGTGQSRDHHLASYWNPEALAEKNRALGCHGTECIDPGASAKKWGMFQGKCEAEVVRRAGSQPSNPSELL